MISILYFHLARGATMRPLFFITASTGKPTFFVTKKGSEKSPAVARQRTPPQGLLAPENPKAVVEGAKS